MTDDRQDLQPQRLNRAGVLRGALGITSVMAFVAPFGLAFGAAAVDRGMPAETIMIMTTVVFAGAAQFAALDFWRDPMPLVALLVTTFAINARMLLMGASLYTWVAPLPAAQRYMMLAVLTDASWAWALKRRAQGERDASILLGAGLALWAGWVAATGIGVAIGADLGDISRYGLDVIMVVFFASLVVGLWKGPEDLLPWAVAAVVGLGGSWLLPAGWHVLAGALAGGTVGALRHAR